jgi:hypothetical protein
MMSRINRIIPFFVVRIELDGASYNLNFAPGSSRARVDFRRERQLILIPRANSLLI